MFKYLAVALIVLSATPAIAEIFVPIPGTGTGIYVRTPNVPWVMTGYGVATIGGAFLAFQGLNTYYVHEILHRRRTFCDQGPINCNPEKLELLPFYLTPNTKPAGIP